VSRVARRVCRGNLQRLSNAQSGAVRWFGPHSGGRWTVLAKPWQSAQIHPSRLRMTRRRVRQVVPDRPGAFLACSFAAEGAAGAAVAGVDLSVCEVVGRHASVAQQGSAETL
jgi:hypothetical protein